MTDRNALEDRYRATFAAMQAAQRQSAAADAAQRRARDDRHEAEALWDAARDELHRWLIGERLAEKEQCDE